MENIEFAVLPVDEDLAKFVLTDKSNQPRPHAPEKVVRFKLRTKHQVATTLTPKNGENPWKSGVFESSKGGTRTRDPRLMKPVL
jgi:hypothetical protein